MNQNHQTDLVVALDFPRVDQAWKVAEKLQDLPVIYKIGIELYMAGGPDLVRELMHRKARVFLDLKLHDYPHVVARAVKQAALQHVEMLSLHLSGGSAVFRAIKEELEEVAELKPQLMGVGVLSSYDDMHWAEITRALTGHAVDVQTSMTGLIDTMGSWGLDGMVCAPSEVGEIKRRYPSFYLMIPEVMPSSSAENTRGNGQLQMTPFQAKSMGASAIIVDRPISHSQDPRSVAESILMELQSCLIA